MCNILEDLWIIFCQHMANYCVLIIVFAFLNEKWLPTSNILKKQQFAAKKVLEFRWIKFEVFLWFKVRKLKSEIDWTHQWGLRIVTKSFLGNLVHFKNPIFSFIDLLLDKL